MSGTPTIDESPGGIHTIEAVSTSVTAFVGLFSDGPMYQPIRITSLSDFERQFGPYATNDTDGYAIQLYFLNGGQDAWVARVDPDTHAEVSLSDTYIAGLKTLDDIEPNLFNLLCLPSAADLKKADGTLDEDGIIKLYQEAAAFCVSRHAFLIVDIPVQAGQSLENIQAWQGKFGPEVMSKNAAVYFPRLLVASPSAGNPALNVPASGAIAGIITRTDTNYGVWKAPAGKDASISGATLSAQLNDQENGTLNTQGINVLRSFPGIGNVVWGARTLVGADIEASEWKYIPVRRMALFLEESLIRGLKWVVFEPNDESLWSAIRLSVGNFLNRLFQAGAFQGSVPDQAYFVKCDQDTTTQDDINRGIVNILVGFAPLRSAEFTIIKIQQIAGQTQM